MIDLDDNRWEGLTGGYRVPYDPRPILRQIGAGSGSVAVWAELWNELHHQGDVGEASYAAVPYLISIQAQSATVDWNLYALISTIEIERHRSGNPALPEWLVESYSQAWRDLLEVAPRDLHRTEDPLAIASILGALALAKGQLKLGAFIAHSDASEIDEFLEQRAAWSDLYRI